MPKKNGKKAKPEKAKKAANPAKKAGPAKGAAKKAVKAAAPKKKIPSPMKSVEVKGKKSAKPAKANEKKRSTPALAKQVPLKKPVKTVLAKKPEKAVEKEKLKAGKKAPLAKNGKQAAEVVVEVPAPKGMALLEKGGKKKGRASGEGHSLSSSRRRCREPGCELDSGLAGYCRLHYIKNWRKIKRKEAILASGQLNNYVEELVNKYPDKYLEVIRQDLASEKDWAKVVVDLELESSEDEVSSDEDMEGVESVRQGGGGRGEFDDDSEGF